MSGAVCGSHGESGCKRGVAHRAGLVEGVTGGAQGCSTGSFLDGLEFVEEFDPADGVLVAGFQAGACSTVE